MSTWDDSTLIVRLHVCEYRQCVPSCSENLLITLIQSTHQVYSSHQFSLQIPVGKTVWLFHSIFLWIFLQFCSQLPNKENPSQRSVKIRQCWFISFRTANRRLVLGCNILLAFRPTGYRSQDAIFHLHSSSHFDSLVCFSIPALVFISAIPFHTCHQKKVV